MLLLGRLPGIHYCTRTCMILSISPVYFGVSIDSLSVCHSIRMYSLFLRLQGFCFRSERLIITAACRHPHRLLCSQFSLSSQESTKNIFDSFSLLLVCNAFFMLYSSPIMWHRYAKRTIGWLCPSFSRCKEVQGQLQRDRGRTLGTMCTCEEIERGTYNCKASKLGPVER